MSKKGTLLNQYEAAALVGISPELLEWFTHYAAKKSGDPRKLKVAKHDGRLVFFDRAELLDFDKWLREPWPHKPGRRPYIPSAVREEVKIEASGACAICHGHAETCEAAHLRKVAITKCNHPHELLWLCANHHTKYDNGSFGPNEEDKEFVQSFKKVLQKYSKILWEGQAKASATLYDFVAFCAKLKVHLEQATTAEQVAAVERIGFTAIEELPKFASVAKSQRAKKAYSELTHDLNALEQTKPKKLEPKLEAMEEYKVEFRYAAGLVECPLCEGRGTYHQMDCPVCDGTGAVDKALRDIDLSPFRYTKCPLCKGSGRRHGEECPECAGSGEMQRRLAELVELSAYKQVKCPLCEGEGDVRGNDCPECSGRGTIERWQADRVDLSEYTEVGCPLCHGTGRFNNDDCPECGGEGQMTGRDADRVDLGDYATVDCPLCKGSGQRNGDTCPVCGGEARMLRKEADRVDLSDYRSVKCPLCRGEGTYKGEMCPECGGEATMDRRLAERVDLGLYKLVKCPLCRGSGTFRGDTCAACEGTQRIERRLAERIDPADYS